MNIGKWVKTPKQFFILGEEIRPRGKWLSNSHGIEEEGVCGFRGGKIPPKSDEWLKK